MMIHATQTDVQAILIDLPAQIELAPIYEERPAYKPQRSASDQRCAALMLEKLCRREDVLHASAPQDADQVLDAVVEKLLDVL